jgi:hypothetical protein
MATPIPPPPGGSVTDSWVWTEWFRIIWTKLNQALTDVVAWSSINFAGSNITDIASRAHNNLQTIQGGTTSEYYHLTQANYNEVTTNLNLSGTSGTGVKIDLTTPTFGWKDLTGEIITKGVGPSDPDWVTYRGSLSQYRFSAGHVHEAWLNFHIPHDYVPGSDLFVHVHWSQITVDTGGTAGVPGVAKWYFDISYSDGHGTAGGSADPFIAPITVSVTQQGSTTQYGHMIAEVQFTNNGGTGGLINSNTIQVDGVIIVRIYRDPADVADTLNQDPFVHYVDIHYQSTNLPTKNKSPNFYV